jgi:hypothetical protein
MEFIIGCVVGLFVGANIALVIFALCNAAGKQDREHHYVH